MKDNSAYTLGRTSIYERLLDNPKGCMKSLGGWAFRTEGDAQAYLKAFAGTDFGDFVLDDSFSVYTLSLPNGWLQDVDQIPSTVDGAHHLLIKAQLGRL